MDPLPNLNRAYSLILQEERQRNVVTTGQPNIETIVLVAQQVNQMTTKNNKALGHKRSNLLAFIVVELDT